MFISIPKLIWLDSCSSDSKTSVFKKLNVHKNLQTFTEVNSCISYIKSHLDETIFLIVSGNFAVEIVPEIYDLSNIFMIFIFCASIKSYTEWAMDFTEKLLMFDHEDDLVQRIWLEMEEYFREQAKQSHKQADQYKARVKQLQQSCN